jgi:3-isopropylmalate/(R)-2-methylmalate dehydratase small subunit
MDKFTKLEGVAAPLKMINVDTDMIIPADYLKTLKRTGLAKGLFQRIRRHADGNLDPDFALNKPAYKDAKILVAGDNFGCGSSREHAPWALHDFGFRAVVAGSFADIFRNNALKNGLLPVAVPEELRRRLVEAPGTQVTIDLETREIALPDGTRASFAVEPFARYCLLEGRDELEFLLAQAEAIAAHEARARVEG